MIDLMVLLSEADRQDVHIAHALQVRAAGALGNFTALFRLYAAAPGHSQHVMDTFADKLRLEALRVVLKAYNPTVPVAFLAANLGFDGAEECAPPSRSAASARHLERAPHACVQARASSHACMACVHGMRRCAFFIEDHGVSFTGDDKGFVDCKASRDSLVDYSISAKEEEARKNEARKAEIVPISFS